LNFPKPHKLTDCPNSSRTPQVSTANTSKSTKSPSVLASPAHSTRPGTSPTTAPRRANRLFRLYLFSFCRFATQQLWRQHLFSHEWFMCTKHIAYDGLLACSLGDTGNSTRMDQKITKYPIVLLGSKPVFIYRLRWNQSMSVVSLLYTASFESPC
jgi:hypothetical protein